MDISHRALSVYTYLADRANQNNECWPSISTIAKDTKLSYSTVRRAIKDLEQLDLITTKHRRRYYGENSTLLFHLNTENQR